MSQHVLVSHTRPYNDVGLGSEGGALGVGVFRVHVGDCPSPWGLLGQASQRFTASVILFLVTMHMNCRERKSYIYIYKHTYRYDKVLRGLGLRCFEPIFGTAAEALWGCSKKKISQQTMKFQLSCLVSCFVVCHLGVKLLGALGFFGVLLGLS